MTQRRAAVDVCRDAYTEFAARPLAAGEARAWTSDTLIRFYGDVNALIETGELVVSELVTNAVRAGSATVRLHLQAHSTRWVLRVQDNASGVPVVIGAAGVDDVGGRGLVIVDAVAEAWGTDFDPDSKTVWASLALPDSAHPGFDCQEAR